MLRKDEVYAMPSYAFFGILLLGAVVPKSEIESASRLLSTALAKYANASSYHVEGTRESSTTDEVEHRWEQQTFTLVGRLLLGITMS
jgi:hypothetical protein